MSNLRYRIYPSILNEFQSFIDEDGYEDKDGNFVPFVTFDSLIKSINREPKEISPEMQKGIDFEEDVLTMCKSSLEHRYDLDNYSGNKFDKYGQVNTNYFNALAEVTNRLPHFFTTQLEVSKVYKDVLFYGKIDIAGEGRVIDLKYTGNYTFPKFQKSYQNLYLWALESHGFKSMEYVISNFRQVYCEYYGLDYDFSLLLQGVDFFKDFLEENRSLITDKKIFIV